MKETGLKEKIGKTHCTRSELFLFLADLKRYGGIFYGNVQDK